MTQMSDNRRADKEGMRKLLSKKYFYQFITIILVLSAIIFAGIKDLIGKEVVGTLFGTVVGSVFKFAYQSKNNKEDKQTDE